MSKAERDPITPDPVAEAGRRLRRLFAAIDANSERRLAASSAARWALESTYEHLGDALTAAEDAISLARAASPEGAMAQVMLALADAGCIQSYVEDAHRAEGARFQRRIERCLHSVLALLADQGADPAAVGGEACGGMPADSPHPAIERAVAA